METYSVLLDICAGNSPVPGEIPAQRPVTRSFDVFFDLRLNKRLSKQWIKTLSCPLWRHCNGLGLNVWGHQAITLGNVHSGENDEANCSWLHPVWPPPKRPDHDNTFYAVSRASTELNFCIHRDFDVRNNVYKPRRLVCECCRDISAWKSRVMKPTVLGDEAICWGAFA